MSTPQSKTVYVKTATEDNNPETTESNWFQRWGQTSLIGGLVGAIIGCLGTLLFGYLTREE